MKTKRFQKWLDVIYGNIREFRFWSSTVRGEGDETLAPDAPLGKWIKIIILKPVGEAKTTFQIGFMSEKYGITQISTSRRRVSGGPFGMRMGPADCEFFIVSNKGKVGLEFVEYVDIRDKKPGLVIY